MGALGGMDGFVVLSQAEEDGEAWILVETTRDVAGCPLCGVRATGHGRSEVQVRDLAMGGRPVRLVWRKRRWICLDPDCPAKSFTEEAPAIEGCLTARAAKEICRRVGQDGHSVAQVARDFGVGWGAAMACIQRHGEPLVDDPGCIGTTRALGIDEHKVLGATRDHRTLSPFAEVRFPPPRSSWGDPVVAAHPSEPRALPAPTVAAPRSVGLTLLPDARRPRPAGRDAPFPLELDCMEQPLSQAVAVPC